MIITSTGPDDEPLDKNYSIDDLSEETYQKCYTDLSDFTVKCADLLDGLDLNHFWLTRNQVLGRRLSQRINRNLAQLRRS
jgi:hypothetical protein